MIDLGDMQFVSFVKHSTYAETEIFSNRYEFMRNIMVLVKMETVEEEKKEENGQQNNQQNRQLKKLKVLSIRLKPLEHICGRQMIDASE